MANFTVRDAAPAYLGAAMFFQPGATRTSNSPTLARYTNPSGSIVELQSVGGTFGAGGVPTGGTVVGATLFAADTITAKLSAPIAAKTKVIAGGAIFNCEADACVAIAKSQTYSVAACKTIADKVGPVTSFAGFKTFDDTKLSDCNAKVMAKAGGATTLAKQ